MSFFMSNPGFEARIDRLNIITIVMTIGDLGYFRQGNFFRHKCKEKISLIMVCKVIEKSRSVLPKILNGDT